MLAQLTYESFAPYLSQKFQIGSDDANVEAELIEVRKLGTGSPGRRDPFSLIFRGPRNLFLPQRIHPVYHDELGALEIFLVPVGLDETGLLYQAIFT